jgi:TRAP-type mannitol/chloroaromatic compound transport system substrate-binding protein
MKCFCILTAIIVLSLLVISCTPDGTSTTKEYELKAHFWIVPTANTAVAINRALDMVEEKSNGRIVFKRTWGATVVTMDGSLDAISQDVADVAYIAQTLFNSKLLRSSVVTTFGGTNKVWPGMVAWVEEYSKLDGIKEEWAKHNALPLWPALGPEATILSRNEIPTMDDVKGVQFYAPGACAQAIGNVDGSCSFLNPPDAYDAFSKGTFDATYFPAVYVLQYRWHEILKHWYVNTNSGALVQAIAFNERTLDTLPQDLRAIIVDMGKETASILYEEIILNTPVLEEYEAQGVQMHYWSDADVARFQEEAIKPITEARLSELEDQGITDIREYFDQWVQMNAKYEAQLADEAAKRGWKDTPD